MAVPKGFRKDINIVRQPYGFEQRQGYLDDISHKGTFLPRGVMYEDMDTTFIEFIENDLEISIDGEKVPVLFLTLQRWSEFSKTWQFSDKYRDIKMPFITIVRQPNPQPGRNQAGLFNIPGRRTYTYLKVPTFEGGRTGVDTYKIPQPTSVDLIYEVRLFCNRMRDLNKLNQLVQKIFQSRQHYIRVNGHPMPVHLENVGDESNIDDFENRRFYVQPFEMSLYGYILDEADFQVIPTVNRAFVVTELLDEAPRVKMKANVNPLDGCANFNFVFKKNSATSFNFNSEYDLKFNMVSEFKNISKIIIKVNNNVVLNGTSITNPIIIQNGDLVNIQIVRINNSDSDFTLIGNRF
jgi:hypothetical protein